MKIGKRGQITVFVILAIILVIVFLLLFLNREKIPTIFEQESPIEEIQGCIEDSLEEGVEKVSTQGGSIDPELHYLYQGNKLEYLCYTEEYYKTCVVQKPLLKKSVETELEDFMNERVEGCVLAIKDSLQERDYSVSNKKPNVTVTLLPGTIITETELDLKITKESTQNIDTIKTDINTKLYELLMIATSIMNWEAQYGDSESMNYMIHYPNIRVEKKEQSDGTTIYIVSDRNTEDRFMFASKSAPLPPGLI